MNRRSFMKTLGLAAAAGTWPQGLATAAEPPHAEQLPIVPFDAPAGAWTLAVLPDTQNMADLFPEEFERQANWIVAHRASHNILFVAHEGDIVDNNADARQWRNARKAMRPLVDAGIPFLVVPGNHDLGSGPATSQDRSTQLNDYFSPTDYGHSAGFGLFEPNRLENSWHLLDAPTGKYLLLALEFGPRDEVVAWAGRVVGEHAGRKVILVTHAHTYYDSTIYDFAAKGPRQDWNPKSYGLAKLGSVNDAADLWPKLITPNESIFLVLSGHVLRNGTGYVIGKRPSGTKVHQVLANYQAAVDPHRPYAGGGFLRLMRFYPDGSKIEVRSYSPWLDQWLTSPDQQFTIRLG